MEANQAERPSQVFTAVRIHHVVAGIGVDRAAVEQAIQLSEQNYCSVGAMIKQTARLDTTFEVIEEPSNWLHAEIMHETAAT